MEAEKRKNRDPPIVTEVAQGAKRSKEEEERSGDRGKKALKSDI